MIVCCKTSPSAVSDSMSDFRMSNEHRLKIKNSNILNVLIEHVQGGREMSSTQVTAGIALLKKVMPDLANVQHSGDSANPVSMVITGVPRDGD